MGACQSLAPPGVWSFYLSSLTGIDSEAKLSLTQDLQPLLSLLSKAVKEIFEVPKWLVARFQWLVAKSFKWFSFYLDGASRGAVEEGWAGEWGDGLEAEPPKDDGRTRLMQVGSSCLVSFPWSSAPLMFHKEFFDLSGLQATRSTFFVVLACRKPELDGFDQHFQATVHFPWTSAVG